MTSLITPTNGDAAVIIGNRRCDHEFVILTYMIHDISFKASTCLTCRLVTFYHKTYDTSSALYIVCTRLDSFFHRNCRWLSMSEWQYYGASRTLLHFRLLRTPITGNSHNVTIASTWTTHRCKLNCNISAQINPDEHWQTPLWWFWSNLFPTRHMRTYANEYSIAGRVTVTGGVGGAVNHATE